MKFKIGDLVTPGPAFVGHKNVFVVEDEDLMYRTFKIRIFADITNSEDNIPHNDIRWGEDELELIRTIESLKEASKNCFIENIMQQTAIQYKNEEKWCEEYLSRNFGPENGSTGGLTVPWTPLPKLQEVKLGTKLSRINKNLFNGVTLSHINDFYPSPEAFHRTPGFEYWNFNYDGNQIIKIIKEEDEMYKILDIYETRERRKINDLYDEKIKSLIEDDEIQKIIKEMENQVRTVAGERAEGYCFAYPGLYEERTAKAIKELEQERDKKVKDLRNKIIDIKAITELAPNYEEKLKILRDYEIMDKKKNIIL